MSLLQFTKEYATVEDCLSKLEVVPMDERPLLSPLC